MKIKAQYAMVLNLDKCIGCHTCSIPCKNVWTNRKGAEYIWFNNVESKPGIGYPKKWEDQSHYLGGWRLRRGRLKLAAGSRAYKMGAIFHNPDLPLIDDYYEPWNYDYEKLVSAPRRRHQPAVMRLFRFIHDHQNNQYRMVRGRKSDKRGNITIRRIVSVGINLLGRTGFAGHIIAFQFRFGSGTSRGDHRTHDTPDLMGGLG